MRKTLCSLLVLCLLCIASVFAAVAPKVVAVPKVPAAPKAPKAPAAAVAAAPAAPAAPAAAAAAAGPVPAIPVSTQQSVGIGALDYYYLNWNVSYAVGDSVDFQLIGNPGAAPPATVAISVYDEFNKVKLADISTSAALTSKTTGVPFSLYKWTVPATLPATFDFTSGYFTIVLAWADTAGPLTKERRVLLNNVKAAPGGKVNPVLATGTGGPAGVAAKSTASSSRLSSAIVALLAIPAVAVALLLSNGA